MEDNKHISTGYPEGEEYAEIDLMDLLRKLLKEWKKILLWAGVAAAVGIVIAFSLPDEYTVTASMVPERSGRQSSSSMSSLASIAGINLGATSSADAVFPALYPQIITSNPFVSDLFAVPVEYRVKDGLATSDYYSFMLDHYREPWWNALRRLPARMARWVKSIFKGRTSPVTGYDELDISHYTSEQKRVLSRIRKSLSLSVDKNTLVVTLEVKGQDPRVAATMAEVVVARLQAFVTEYRTEKARRDLNYYQKLHDEYKDRYFTSQQRYASYLDSHQGVVLQRVRTEQERLQNEMNLNYQLYYSCAQQLQAAQAKVQEETPVFTIINPPTYPLVPSGPSRGLIIFAFAFLGAMAGCFWILFVRDWKERLKRDS